MKRQGTSPNGGGSQNVRVVARVRPTNKIELDRGGVVCLRHTEQNVEVKWDGSENKFNLDRIFGETSTQGEVFDYTARPLITDVLNGYNATIFAYGQTGTGKTHTMEGVVANDDLKGIIPRAVEALFEGVSEADENIEFVVKVSYVEIYLEKIRDLLDSNRLKVNLTVREDKIKGIYIAGVTEEYVTSVAELLQIMHEGASNRAVAATGMNEGSSRSHSVFTITVEQKDVLTNATKQGKLVLVDLAGSEMVRKTNASGQQLEEAKMINKSLSALGQVINALTDEKSTHVPYRDSKLTRVLQDSLGGNSKTCLIVAISPSSFNAAETVSTLRFGSRAKSIENKATVNQTRSVEELEAILARSEKAIDAQSTYIQSLQTQFQALQAAYDRVISAGGVPAQDGVAPTQSANSVVLEEGKVVVDIAKLEQDAATLRKLQDTINALNQELEDERADSLRKDAEIQQLNKLLADKERLISEAEVMLAEVNHSNEALKARAEVLLREKIEAVGELESMRSTREDEIAKSRFNLMEIEATLSTLRAENKRLREEIAELGGDSAKNAPSKSVVEVEEDDTVVSSGVIRRLQTRRSVGADDNQSLGSQSTMSDSQRKVLMEIASEKFAAACLAHRLDDKVSTDLFSILDEYANDAEKAYVALEEKANVAEKTGSRRVRELEDQRTRLERDLQARIESIFKLEANYEALHNSDARTMADGLAQHDRARQKSLQQRLEQLVAVHRQLLRKFGSLELENAELKKKTLLRDERIRQLENNSRTLVTNVRQQAERHLAEVASFRDQLALAKSEYESRSDSLKEQTSTSRSPNALRSAAPKALRGGGGKLHKDGERPISMSHPDFDLPSSPTAVSAPSPPTYEDAKPPAAPAPAPATRMGMFSRLMSRN